MEEGNKFFGSYERESFRGSTDVVIYKKFQPDPRAEMAIDFATKWGMVAATPDGEDSSGRAKLRRLTVEELVGHACQTTDAIFAEFENRGWLMALPAPKAPEAKE